MTSKTPTVIASATQTVIASEARQSSIVMTSAAQIAMTSKTKTVIASEARQSSIVMTSEAQIATAGKAPAVIASAAWQSSCSPESTMDRRASLAMTVFYFSPCEPPRQARHQCHGKRSKIATVGKTPSVIASAAWQSSIVMTSEAQIATLGKTPAVIASAARQSSCIPESTMDRRASLAMTVFYFSPCEPPRQTLSKPQTH